jgi:hypothetical protein
MLSRLLNRPYVITEPREAAARGLRPVHLYLVLAIALAALYFYAGTQRYAITITDGGRIYNRVDRWTGTVAIWHVGTRDAMPRWVAIHTHPPQQ